MFSWTLYDKKQDRIIAARDPIGITSFYQGWSSDTPGAVYFASELKCLFPVCDKVISFPPGHIYDSKTGKTTRYFEPSWWDPKKVPSTPIDYKLIRRTLEKSVRKRLMAEVPYGVLLSGGLDSSLTASIAQRETMRLREAAEKRPQTYSDHSPEGLVGIDDSNELSTVEWFPQLHSFSIGLPGAPDTEAAIKVADFLKTKHHAFTFTIQEGLDALSDVIYHLESYDVTTIRASTPMFLLSRKIKAMGVKMVLSGEGSDEIFGGYLYFHAAPDKAAFHEETVRRVKNLHTADCLRANKSTAAWGVEARVPFLDKEVQLCFNLMIMSSRVAVPQRCYGHRSGRENDHKRSNREVHPPEGLRYQRRAGRRAVPPRQDPVAAKRAVQRRGRLRLDRRSEGPGGAASHRRADEASEAEVGRRRPRHQGGLLVPLHVRRALSTILCIDRHALGTNLVEADGPERTRNLDAQCQVQGKCVRSSSKVLRGRVLTFVYILAS